VIYRAYGFSLHSNIIISALPPLLDEVKDCDLRVEIGPAPEWVSHASSLLVSHRRLRNPDTVAPGCSLTHLGEDFCELSYEDGTRFIIDRQARRIWGQAGQGLSDQDALVYLLGPVMGFILRQRDTLALHASALQIAGSACLLCGGAGVGKSTTAAALALRGWPVISEDVCALAEIAGITYAVPGYPRVCLWPDSVKFLFPSEDALPLIVDGWNKRFLPLDDHRATFASQSVPLAAIYYFAARSDDSAAPLIEPLSPRESLILLGQNTYMNWLLSQSQRVAEFDAVARLVSAVECFQLTPSSDPSRLPALASLIERHFSSLCTRRFAAGQSTSFPDV